MPARKGGPTLTDKQRRFCEAVVAGSQQDQAYVAAGFKASNFNSAGAAATRLLKMPHVAEYISGLRAKAAAGAGVTAERVLREFARIGFFDIRKVIEWGGGEVRIIPSHVVGDDTAAAIQKIKVKTTRIESEDGPPIERTEIEVQMASKISALTKLGEHLALFESELQKPAPQPPPPARYRGKDMSKRRTDSIDPTDSEGGA